MKIPKETGFFSSFDGTPIYYEVRGEGPPLVFCYGIGCLINHWQHQIKAFSPTYRTIAFDYRAHHRSPIPKDLENLTIDALADDLKRLSEHLKLGPAAYLGHSFGTQVLVRAYDMFPEMFSHLVFVNGFASDPIRGMFGNEAASTLFHLVKEGYDLLPETLGRLWRMVTDNPLSIPLAAILGGFNLHLTHLKDIEIYLRGVAAMDLDAFLTLFENMMTYDGRPVFDRITVPTLIIGGRRDSVTPTHYQEEMHKRIRNSQLLLVPYGSHCTQLDMPDYVNLKIEKFLRAEEGGLSPSPTKRA